LDRVLDVSEVLNAVSKSDLRTSGMDSLGGHPVSVQREHRAPANPRGESRGASANEVANAAMTTTAAVAVHRAIDQPF
jgi:hypothetical protein